MSEQKIMEALISIQTTTMTILEEQNKIKEQIKESEERTKAELRQEIKEAAEKTKIELRQEIKETAETIKKELRTEFKREIKTAEKNIIEDVSSNMAVFKKYVDSIANRMDKYQAV